MINIPNFNTGQVPIPRPVQPFQQPQHYDPAGIIMQASALQQQKEFAQQQIEQKYMQDFISSIQSASELSERKREAQARELQAQTALEMATSKLPLEKALMQAHANYFQSQADMMQDPDTAKRLFSLTQPGPNGEPPKMSLEQFALLAPRGAQRLMFAKAAAENPDVDMMKGTTVLAGKKQAATTQESSTIQMPLRMSNAVLPALNLLNRIGDAVASNKGDVQFLNKGLVNIGTGVGSVSLQALKTQTNNFVQAYNQQFGRGTDRKLDADIDALNSAQSPAQFKIAVALTKADIISKRNAIGNLTPDYKSVYDDAIAPMPKYSSRSYLQSLGQDYSHDEAVRSLQTAREAGLIED